MTNRLQFCLILTTCILISSSNAETEQVRNSLVQFMSALSRGINIPREANWGWNTSSDPCNDDWKGISCYNNSPTVKKIILDNELNLTGSIDAAALCAAASITVLSLNSIGVAGALPEEISKCSKLTHVYLRGNRLSGSLPVSLSRLKNLKRLDVSSNGFSGGIPDLSRISGLLTFLAENNQLNGTIPNFDFSNFEEFNVSNNGLTGAIPDGGGRRFGAASFLNNPRLCGPPLTNACPPPPPPAAADGKKSSSSKKDYFIYSGYALIGVIVVLLIAVKLRKKSASREKKLGFERERDSMHEKISGSSSDHWKGVGGNRSEFSITPESGRNSSSLTVLYSPLVNGLKFEDLLRSPAELMSRGRHGSLYRVTVEEGVNLAVKRIRDWEIGRDEFKNRMQRIDGVRHPNVMPIVAFYCSRQEKLLVYHFQHNGSLFNLLHGSENGTILDWGSRLNIAAKAAAALAFMHEGLKGDGIPHGNLKSSNILLSKEMEPLISEYGLAEVEVEDQSFLGIDSFQEGGSSPNSPLQRDVSSFGVLLLELLTGKLVQNNGVELARWVNSAIREEWTVEVFDKALVVEGASEERMLMLLQLALKCINSNSAQVKPSMREVADVISGIREQDEKSVSFDHSL